MRDILLTAIVLGFVPVSIARPWIGILVFAWLGYMNPHRYTWGFAYSMPFAAMIGAAIILGFLFTKDKDRLPLYPLMVVWILWILWMNFTTLFALNPAEAIDEWNRAMKIQLTSILTISLMQSRKKLELLIWVVALSVGFYGIKGGIFRRTDWRQLPGVGTAGDVFRRQQRSRGRFDDGVASVLVPAIARREHVVAAWVAGVRGPDHAVHTGIILSRCVPRTGGRQRLSCVQIAATLDPAADTPRTWRGVARFSARAMVRTGRDHPDLRGRRFGHGANQLLVFRVQSRQGQAAGRRRVR